MWSVYPNPKTITVEISAPDFCDNSLKSLLPLTEPSRLHQKEFLLPNTNRKSYQPPVLFTAYIAILIEKNREHIKSLDRRRSLACQLRKKKTRRPRQLHNSSKIGDFSAGEKAGKIASKVNDDLRIGFNRRVGLLINFKFFKISFKEFAIWGFSKDFGNPFFIHHPPALLLTCFWVLIFRSRQPLPNKLKILLFAHPPICHSEISLAQEVAPKSWVRWATMACGWILGSKTRRYRWMKLWESARSQRRLLPAAHKNYGIPMGIGLLNFFGWNR